MKKRITGKLKNIFTKILTLLWLVSVITLLIFVIAIIPAQKDGLRESMEMQAQSMATSIAEVTLSSLAVDDYATVVDHCMKVVNQRDNILYIVITRQDGSSNIFREGSWTFEELSGLWKPDSKELLKSRFLDSSLVKEDVFHSTYPLEYSGLDMGWIHTGISLGWYDNQLDTIYHRTGVIALISIFLGLIFSFIFARKISQPIHTLNKTTQRITEGDLSARAQIETGDEIEHLADSFNNMAETMEQSQKELENSRDILEQKVNERTSALNETNKKLIREINDRKKAEEEIIKLSQAVETTPAGVCLTDTDGKIIYINPGLLAMGGEIPREQVVGQVMFDFLNDEQTAILENEVIPSLKSDGKWTGEFYLIRSDNEERVPVETIASVIRDEDGKIKYFLSHYYDITERKNYETKMKDSLREKEVLLKEIHHRVKNNLQIISSLLFLQSKSIKDQYALDLFRDSQNRVKSMALIHEKLYQSKDITRIDFSDYIKNLTKYLMQSFRGNDQNIGVDLDIENIGLDINYAIPCGLIINELVSNSFKYAFSDQNGEIVKPEINIIFKQNGSGTIDLTVKDNGKGLPDTFDFRNTESLGMQLVCNLTDQLNGKIELNSKDGVEFNIGFMLEG